MIFLTCTVSRFLTQAIQVFFYPSGSHKEALTSLLYVIKAAKGLSLLTGEIGSGKTQVIQVLKDTLRKDNDNVICEVLNSKLSEAELLYWLSKQLGSNSECIQDSDNELFDAIKRELVLRISNNSNFRVVIIFDESQLLSQGVLEKIRLLSNLEFEHKKLIQIVLIGQPELEKRLEERNNRSLIQRISIHKKLSYLDEENTKRYIQFRLNKAGSILNPFSDDAIRQIYLSSRGSPRLINLLCDNSMFIGFFKKKTYLDQNIINESVADVPLSFSNKTTPCESKQVKPLASHTQSAKHVIVKRPRDETKGGSNSVEKSHSVSEPMMPNTASKVSKAALFEHFWIKIFGVLVALFILLWTYDFLSRF